MLAVVSHDLRGPLHAIAMRESLLEANQSDPVLVAHAQAMQRSAAAMQRMIALLLDATSLGVGELHLDLGQHDLRELAAEVVDVLGPVAAVGRVRLEVRIAELPPLHLDRQRIVQTLYNLAGNALKFTPAGGAVVIAAELRDHELEVSVADTGCGIAPEALPRIFDRYFTTENGHRGTGLGLYIARGVVRAHGGRIWVESAVGKGSTFHFTLPMTVPAASP